jgi:hypothetical protein
LNIAEYFESVKDRLLTDSVVVDFKFLKRVDRSNNGHLRIRVFFSDNSKMEFSEFIEQSMEGEIRLVTYSYHWADENDNLIRRWDSTKHFPDLENFPHHIHVNDKDVTSGKPINIFEVLDEIAAAISK